MTHERLQFLNKTVFDARRKLADIYFEANRDRHVDKTLEYTFNQIDELHELVVLMNTVGEIVSEELFPKPKPDFAP